MRILPRFTSLPLSLRLCLATGLASVGLCLAVTAQAGVVAGDRAPDFLLYGASEGDAEAGEKGEIYRLSEHVGKRGVVLAFFPKAFTPG